MSGVEGSVTTRPGLETSTRLATWSVIALMAMSWEPEPVLNALRIWMVVEDRHGRVAIERMVVMLVIHGCVIGRFLDSHNA